MFGIGWGEIIVLGIIAVLVFVPLIFFLGVLPSLRKSASTPTRRNEIEDLRDEIAELRKEIERLKHASSKDITAGGPK
jgi:F0F1-type ATP synthase membrane subunit b/b'